MDTAPVTKSSSVTQHFSLLFLVIGLIVSGIGLVLYYYWGNGWSQGITALGILTVIGAVLLLSFTL